MGVTAFKSQPSCEAVCGFLGRAIAKAKKAPRYVVCDRGGQFDCPGFRTWCRRKGIKPPRYGAINKHGSIAVVERAILTIKTLLGHLLLVPYRREAFMRELNEIVAWYNQSRPHTWLGGKTPNEVYHGTFPANRRPKIRAACQVATWVAVFATVGTGTWQPRRETDAGSQLSGQPQAPTHRHVETSGVSGVIP